MPCEVEVRLIEAHGTEAGIVVGKNVPHLAADLLVAGEVERHDHQLRAQLLADEAWHSCPDPILSGLVVGGRLQQRNGREGGGKVYTLLVGKSCRKEVELS